MDMFDTTADPETLTRRADELLGAQRPGAARALLAAAQRLAPRAPRTASLAARMDMREGNPAACLAALGQAITLAPRADLLMLRADARRQIGDLVGAASDAADAVIHDRLNPAAKALLGVLLVELGRPEDAVLCLTEAVKAVPANPAFREGLAGALAAAGQPVAAAATYAAGIVAAPGSLALRNAAIMLALRGRHFAAAITLADAACAVGIADVTTFGLKGHALSNLGRHEAAADAYADALKLGPEDATMRRIAATPKIRPDATRAPVDYLRSVFDGYADDFDTHLISLGYRIPGVMRGAVCKHLLNGPDSACDSGAAPRKPVAGSPPEMQGAIQAGLRGQIGPVLDLGCGTGLVPVALSDLPLGPWVGVDLAPKMLERAAAKKLYAELHEADIIDFLSDDPRQWKLILAADVMCYVGALEFLFAAVHASLLPGALFISSAEELVGPNFGNGDWVLGRRFAHARDYVARAADAAGLTVRAIDAEVQRYDAGAAVAGFLIVLERPDAIR